MPLSSLVRRSTARRGKTDNRHKTAGEVVVVAVQSVVVVMSSSSGEVQQSSCQALKNAPATNCYASNRKS